MPGDVRVLFHTIELSLSPERLIAFRLNTHVSEAETLGYYLWNMGLCEALYPILQFFEVTLRNNIHTAAREHFENEEWFSDERLIFGLEEQQAVRSVINRLNRESQRSANNYDVNDIVASLNFGFWKSLFKSKYEQSFLVPILKTMFPSMPNSQRNTRHLSARMTKIWKLRNKVAHHGRICHWRDLREQHRMTLETLGYMNPGMLLACRLTDRFEEVYTEGPAIFHKKVEDELSSLSNLPGFGHPTNLE